MNPSPDSLELRETSAGTILKVKVSAGARRTAIGGVHGGMLKISVTAAPEKGKANEAVIACLATALAINPSAIQIVGGPTNSRKTLLVAALSAETLNSRLAKSLQKG